MFEVDGKSHDRENCKWRPQPVGADDEKNHYSNQQKRKMVPAGNCLVEFATAEELEKAAADLVGESPKRVLELKGQTLVVQKVSATRIDARKSEKPKKNGKDDDKDDKKDNKRKSEEIEVKVFTLDWKPGCVIELKGLDAETLRPRSASRDAKGISRRVR
jgi:hypothetical protein